MTRLVRLSFHRVRMLPFAIAAFAAACSNSHGSGSTTLVPATKSGAGATSVPAGASAPGITPNTANPNTSTATGGPLAGGSISLGEPTRQAYCAGHGAPIAFQPNGSGPISVVGANCQQGLASRLFQYGLCSCTDAVFTGAFAIDALDSSRPNPSSTPALASIGVDGNVASTGALDVHGSLIASGGGLSPITSGAYTIDGNYEANGDLIATGANIHFGRDLWIDGNITAVGLADVAGNVYQTPGHSQTGMTIGGQVIEQAFQVPTPCACGDNQILDIDAIVAAGKANNHNQDLGLSQQTLIEVGVGAPLALDCGRFAFDGGYLVGDITIAAHGRTALFIDGDLAITGRFGVDLGTSGELDVFVTGNLLLTGAGDVGSVDRPSALRFYVGGAGDIAITGADRFAASLYAPRANVFVTGADDIYGSFFVGSYYATGAERMHYDAAILEGGTGPSCQNDCSADLDCENAQVCRAGRCTQLVSNPF